MSRANKLALLAINLFLFVLAFVAIGFCAWGKFLVLPAIIVILVAFVATEFARRAMRNKEKLESLQSEVRAIADNASVSDAKNPSECELRLQGLAATLPKPEI